jgi:hypothetical protein
MKMQVHRADPMLYWVGAPGYGEEVEIPDDVRERIARAMAEFVAVQEILRAAYRTAAEAKAEARAERVRSAIRSL